MDGFTMAQFRLAFKKPHPEPFPLDVPVVGEVD
jgi:hypothetical protein